jgi:uncharacterized membrane protein
MKDAKVDYLNDGQVMEAPYTDAGKTAASDAYIFIRSCNFYKLFWLFIIGSIFGCYMEQIQYYFLRGIWESRAGVIWGPFSEIYGFGAVLLFLLLHKAYKSSPLTVFIASSVCGSTFEFLARLFQEIFFGSISWDYSGKVLNIKGRTSLEFGIYWGLLGLLFVKWIFPFLNRLLERMQGRFLFALTWLLILFMAVDLLASALAVNRWNERIQEARQITTLKFT